MPLVLKASALPTVAHPHQDTVHVTLNEYNILMKLKHYQGLDHRTLTVVKEKDHYTADLKFYCIEINQIGKSLVWC